MNNLDHVKNFYPENYKMDLSETMKAALSKGPATGGGPVGGINVGSISTMNSSSNLPVSHVASLTPEISQVNANIAGHGYVTEKLYMLLQLYLQNKGWNPSVELLQCFSELKDSAMLPSAAYLQVLANRLTLDAQGRLILRENGKIVLPFEHFANAVMLKHMSGPHGIHLSIDATVRAVIESYTIGRDNFGMEKEFIVEVVQSCPSPACRYYKNHMGISPLPFIDQQYPGVSPEFLQHMPHLPPPPPHPMSSATSVGSSSGSSSGGGEVDLSKSQQQHNSQKVPPQMQHLTKQQQNSLQSQLSQITAAAAAAAAAAVQKQQQQQHQQAVVQQAAAHHQQQLQQQQQVVAAQQQAAAAAAVVAAQQKQHHQQQQQQQQHHHVAQQQAAAVAAQQQQQHQITAALIQQQNRVIAQQNLEKFGNFSSLEKQRVLQQLDQKHFEQNIPIAVAAAAANMQMQGLIQNQSSIGNSPSSSNNNHHQLPSPSIPHLPPPPPSPVSTISSAHSSSSSSSHSDRDQQQHLQQINQKNVEVLKSNLESLESNKDLLALHNGAWGSHDNREGMLIGQEKIVRAFAELMRNMARMKTYIRPSMCKPYGKQSESLQKTLLDTIQLVQSLRNCLPAPHIPVSSWKSEDRHRKEPDCSGISGTNNSTATCISGGQRVENLSN